MSALGSVGSNISPPGDQWQPLQRQPLQRQPLVSPGELGSEGCLAAVAMRPSTRWFWLCGWAVVMALATLVSPHVLVLQASQ